mgnify:CR=1 FL=1
MLHAQHAVPITAVRFSRSDLYSKLLEQLGVQLSPELLELAFTHRSFAYETGISTTNERLEFLGDAVLSPLLAPSVFGALNCAAQMPTS